VNNGNIFKRFRVGFIAEDDAYFVSCSSEGGRKKKKLSRKTPLYAREFRSYAPESHPSVETSAPRDTNRCRKILYITQKIQPGYGNRDQKHATIIGIHSSWRRTSRVWFFPFDFYFTYTRTLYGVFNENRKFSKAVTQW